jgi:hypothetical protein
VNRSQLVKKIKSSLKNQGFRVSKSRVLPPENLDKDTIRKLHSVAAQHRIAEAEASLHSHENSLLTFIANGSELNPLSIVPTLVEVKSGTVEEKLFRYATLHWTIPISSGYGRRLRFLVMDRNNNKLIGIIGLCDPVIALSGRDQWINWSEKQRFERLRHVMDAFVLGAVPPYSQLLFGKFIALLCGSDEIRQACYRKYHGTRSLIRGTLFDGRIALITTMSALGRSSLYNRLNIDKRKVFHSVGFSRGTGEFHFSNGLYAGIAEYATRYCEPTYRKAEWGQGFRNRREVIRKCLKKLKLNVSWSYHGIERECFVVPLAQNAKEFLRGEQKSLKWSTLPQEEIFSWFQTRWLFPRIEWDSAFKDFDRQQYKLWSF